MGHSSLSHESHGKTEPMVINKLGKGTKEETEELANHPASLINYSTKPNNKAFE